MSDIARWLGDQGLQKYLGVFEENEIDAEALPELTEEDFREMGIPIGPRRKMLKAIRELATPQATPASDSGDVSAADKVQSTASPTPSAERRQLTVMFTDLAGSTELSTKLDPEDLRDINRAYQDAVAIAIERFGGYVARYMGDGVLAYFGYPQAHENDAERAARSALEIVNAIPALDTSVKLSVRVGIATGPVVVGDIIGSGASQESAVVGETPNMAARLEGVAGANRIAISAATHRLIENRFEFESLGRMELKGLEDSGEIFRVLGVNEGARFGATQARGLLPMVGRTEELDVLFRRWQLSAENEGQIVVLAGEAGIGKSRMVQAFLEQASPVPAAVVDLHCSPFGVNDALHPVVEYVTRVADLTPGGDSEDHKERLSSWLGESAATIEFAVAILARALSISIGDSLPPEVTPKVQKARTIAVLVEHLVRLTQKGPLFVLVEDAQWADPSTWEFLEVLIETGEAASMFIALTMRPEIDPPWHGRGNVTHLSLNRLGRRDTADFISLVAGGKSMPSELVGIITERSDGTPLFVEELTRNLLETGLFRDTGAGYEIEDSVYAMAVPSTLQDSLMARLDRLGAAKEIAQVGAVFGREFDYDQISHLAALDGNALDEGLDQLVSAEILSRRGTLLASRYVFRQSLVREAAYSSLLLARRRALHEKVAEMLEALPAEQLTDRHQLLAYHHEKAGNPSHAVRHWCLAAEEQATDFAVQEATRIYEHALRLGEESDELIAPERVTVILHRLAELMFMQGRFAESAQFALQMRTLAHNVVEPRAEAAALLAMANAYMWLEDFDTALEHANAAEVLADSAGIASAHAGAATLSGYIHGVSGRLEESQIELDRSIAIAEQHCEYTYVPQALFMAACIQNWTGRYDDAITIANRGRESAQEQRQIAHYLRCHWARAAARIGKGDLQGGYEDLSAGLTIAEKMGDRSYIPRYLNTLGWLYDECHAFDKAVAHCERALEFDRGSTGATGVERQAFSQANWADALIGLGDLQAAKEMLDSVHGLVSNPRTHEWMRWRYTTHVLASVAQYWIATGDPKQAWDWASQCLVIASEKKSWKYVSMAKRLSGVIHMHAKDWDAATAAFSEAYSIAQRIRYPNGVWRVHADFVSLMEARGDQTTAASQHLAAAQSILTDAQQTIADKHLSSVFGTSNEVSTLLAR